MEVKIDTEYIKLDQLLKFSGLADTGGIAKEVIQNGEVLVNGEVETRRGKKIKKEDVVEFRGEKVVVK